MFQMPTFPINTTLAAELANTVVVHTTFYYASKRKMKLEQKISYNQDAHRSSKELINGQVEQTFHFKKLEPLTIHQIDSPHTIILGTASVKISGPKGVFLRVRALCDNGSQVNLITAATVHQLNENPKRNRTTFSGIGGTAPHWVHQWVKYP